MSDVRAVALTVCTVWHPLQGASKAQAKEWISQEQLDTAGATQELHLDARKGIDPPRAIAEGISQRLGMSFQEHVVKADSGKDSVEVKMYARSLLGVFGWMARFVDRRHTARRASSIPLKGTDTTRTRCGRIGL